MTTVDGGLAPSTSNPSLTLASLAWSALKKRQEHGDNSRTYQDALAAMEKFKRAHPELSR